jgi:tRNA(Ile)-lysidine synthase
LFELFRPYGLSGTQIENLTDVIRGTTGGQIFTSSNRILKDRGKILVTKKNDLADNYFRIEHAEDLNKIRWIKSAEFVDIESDFEISDNPSIAFLDSSELSFPMIIRRWKKGDYFYPLGMNDKKKLSDFFIDSKLSLIDKDKIMILETAGRIAWIIGERIDNRFRIKPSTTRALIIKLT